MTDEIHDSTLDAGADMTPEDWYGPDAATFGDRLAAARDQSGMTQAQLARRLGVKLSTLRGWEEDISEPRANRLSMIAGILGVSIMWLLNGEGDGLDAPGTDEFPDGADALFKEMRDLRANIAQASERLGRLEKHLRTVLKASQ